MCGICGYISKEKIDDNRFIKMRDTMLHRGPDDAGLLSFEHGSRYIGFAHRRLAIIDLSDNGHQPMTSEDGNVVIAFNGEVYNFSELRKQLRDYPFHSQTDTEVMIAAYQKWGIHFIDKCNGMFAIALFDKKRGRLYLIRDRMGQKPLYYYYSGDTFVFASELKPIMNCPSLDLKINKRVIK